jgi:serine/threonine protein kinase
MPDPPYPTLRTLGQGASSIVVLCQDASTGSPVAVKAIPRPDNESRFVNEASINKKVLCDQIIKVLGSFLTDAAFYHLFEVGSSDLFSRVASGGPLTEAAAKVVFCDVEGSFSE